MKEDITKRLQSLALTLQEGWGRDVVQDAIDEIHRMDALLEHLADEVEIATRKM